MKHLKKLASVLLALSMVLALAVPAFADGETGDPPVQENPGSTAAGDASITINPGDNTKGPDEDGTVNTEYHYYQIFHASLDTNNNPQAASYYLAKPKDQALKDLVDAVKIEKGNNDVDVFSFTESADGTRWIVSLNSDLIDETTKEVSADDAKAIASALNTNAIKGAALSDGEFVYNSANENAVADNLERGYYLITSTLGTELVLYTLGDVTITTKNDYITNDKQASKTNMNVGDIVKYTIKVTIPASAKVDDIVTVEDTLETDFLKIVAGTDGTDLAENFNFTTDDITSFVTAEVVNGDGETVANATVTLSNGWASRANATDKSKDNPTFAVNFPITEAMLGGSVNLIYHAELLSTAATDKGYVNDVFSHIPAYTTGNKQIKVWTFDFDLDKSFTGDNTDNFEAEFKLYATDESGAKTGSSIRFTTDDNGTRYVKAGPKASNEDTTDTLKVTGGANINVSGLAEGTYVLEETKTQDGYNLLDKPVYVTITDKTVVDETTGLPTGDIEHEVTYKVGSDGDVKGKPATEGTEGTVTLNHVVAIENSRGSLLPSTGGIGTTIFYIVGGVLLVGAVVLLIAKRRTSADEE